MEKLCFQSFGSGSSGNCYYIGNSKNGILIDAGVAPRRIRLALRAAMLDLTDILGIFVTHDHTDHVKFVSTLGEDYNIPVYSTERVHRGIDSNFRVNPKLALSRQFIEKNKSMQIGDFLVTPFPVSHDATDSVGYAVEYNGKKFTVATDLGCVGAEAAAHLAQSDFVVLEANYDAVMLETGSYPDYLKERIASDSGHLSNVQAGAFLAEHYSEKMKYVFLCHLSKENNLPDLAYSAVKAQLEQRNIIVGEALQLVTLERYLPSVFYKFD
jgi:phosphoribosyl 1,2-cyclic phosphodiesterase